MDSPHITTNGNWRLNGVEMDGRKYDFLRRIGDNRLLYRESAHLGGIFAPIGPDSRYKPSVRRVLSEVIAKFRSTGAFN